MEEFSKHGQVGLAGLKAGMSRKTASKYLRDGQLPSDIRKPRHWRTREDPFEDRWPEIADRLADAPELEAKALFEDLVEGDPESFHAGQLRTFQRRVRQWRAQEGPEKMVFFAQEHRPGEAAQTDFTWCTELEVTIGGEPFAHMLCHVVLPYSNWEWATVCHSESMAALRRGVQTALFRLGRIPEFHQTDNSTAATHALGGDSSDRGFNEEYLALMRHLGMKPRTIQVGEKHQNGDVESLNGAVKRRLRQHLLLRGSADFQSVEEYERWLWGVLEKANAMRSKRIAEELEAMQVLLVDRLLEYSEIDVRVTSWSTIRVKRNTYSVPSRLMRERVRVRLYEDRIEVLHGGVLQLECERLRGEGGSRINYRHIIWSLVRKPGAFARYRYREDLFPSLTFRKSYDALCAALSQWRADIEYLRILNLAAETMESSVEATLAMILEADSVPLAESVKELVAPDQAQVPDIAVPDVDLESYDSLLEEQYEETVEVPA